MAVTPERAAVMRTILPKNLSSGCASLKDARDYGVAVGCNLIKVPSCAARTAANDASVVMANSLNGISGCPPDRTRSRKAATSAVCPLSCRIFMALAPCQA